MWSELPRCSAAGKYLLDDRTAAVRFDQYKAELSKSLARSIESVRRVDNWRSTDAVRLGIRQRDGNKGVYAPDRGLAVSIGNAESL